LKKEIIIPEMQKKSAENIQSLQVDSVSGNYCITIPEWIVNELSWYEDTEIKLSLDGNELVLTEKK
jgi:antitoxin component of MazEF toxin-antitoxin module